MKQHGNQAGFVGGVDVQSVVSFETSLALPGPGTQLKDKGPRTPLKHPGTPPRELFNGVKLKLQLVFRNRLLEICVR